MPAQIFKLQIDNSQFAQGLQESAAAATTATGQITASLQQIEGGGKAGANGIHLVGDSLKMTRAEIRESNGSIAMLGEVLGVHIPRHARAAIASLEMIGPAMNAAFNAVVVIAVADAIFKAGEKVYEFFKKADEAAEKNKQANDEFAASLNKSNLELDVANDKTEKHIAQLEKKPYNGLKAALDEAVLSSVTLAQKLDAAIQKQRELLQTQDHGVLAQSLQGKGGTAASQDYLNTYNTGQNNIDIDFQNQLDHARQIGATKADIDAIELKHLQAKADLTRDTYNTVAAELKDRKEMADLADQTNVQRWQAGTNGRLAQLQHRFGSSTEDTSAMQGMLGNLGVLAHSQYAEAQGQQDRTTEGNDEEKNRVAEVGKQSAATANTQQMKGFEDKLAALKLTHKLTIQEEIAFWQQMQAETRKGSANWNAINKTLGTETQQSLAEGHTGFNAVRKSMQSDLTDKAPEDPAHEMEQEQAEDVLHVGERWAAFNSELAKGNENYDTLQRELALTNLELNLSHGLITKHDAAMQEAAIHAKEYADKIAALRAELKHIADDASLTPVQKATATQRVNNQISGVQGQAEVSGIKDRAAVNDTTLSGSMNDWKDKTAQSFTNLPNQLKQLNDQFLTGMNNNIADMILGDKTNWAAFLKQLAGTLVGDGLKQLEGAALGMLPGFADGGYTGSDPIMVGERGPEIFNPGNGGTITPNNKMGGGSSGAFYYIDAREGDTATLNRNMMRGLVAVHGQAVQDATNVQREKAARMPRGSY